jgi:thiamine biosynthesis lipoprotein
MQQKQFIGGGIIVALVVLVGVGLWQTEGQPTGGRITMVHEPQGAMGTTCKLALVVIGRPPPHAGKALKDAENVLRAVEAKMSVWLKDSEVSHFNASEEGKDVPLSPATRAVLRASQQAAAETEGAFDVTCQPLVKLWKRAGDVGVLPTELQLTDAHGASNWELIELTGGGAIKRRATACIDLGGIAKGYAIDRAAEAMQRPDVAGGMVDVGGDVLCFGQQENGEPWLVEVKNPFGPDCLAKVCIRDRAVCTSGNYARYTEIAGKRYGHIIDPRVGRPADAAESVTVVAPTALTADIWATALCVLGRDGLQRLPVDINALMVVGSRDDYHLLCTAGFLELFKEPLPERLMVWEPE